MCLCLSAGWGGDSTEPCRCPRLRPSSPVGATTKPLCVFRKVGWQVRNLFIVLFIPSSNHNTHILSVLLFFRLPLGNLSNINIDTKTLEFQVHRNQVRPPFLLHSCHWFWLRVEAGLTGHLFFFTDISNKVQFRVCGRLNQTVCVQPAPAAWRSQVAQCEVHPCQQPQRLLPAHSQVTPVFNAIRRAAICVHPLIWTCVNNLGTTWLWSTPSYFTDEGRLRAWKWQGSFQDRAARWGIRWPRLCWRTAQRVSAGGKRQHMSLSPNLLLVIQLCMKNKKTAVENFLILPCSICLSFLYTKLLQEWIHFGQTQTFLLNSKSLSANPK